MFYLLLEPLGVLGYEVSHLPEPPEPNFSDGYTLTRVDDETNFEEKEVVPNFIRYFRTGIGTPLLLLLLLRVRVLAVKPL